MEIIELMEGILTTTFFPKGRKVRRISRTNLITSTGFHADIKSNISVGSNCFCGGKIILFEIRFGDRNTYGLYCGKCEEEYLENVTLKDTYEMVKKDG